MLLLLLFGLLQDVDKETVGDALSAMGVVLEGVGPAAFFSKEQRESLLQQCSNLLRGNHICQLNQDVDEVYRHLKSCCCCCCCSCCCWCMHTNALLALPPFSLEPWFAAAAAAVAAASRGASFVFVFAAVVVYRKTTRDKKKNICLRVWLRSCLHLLVQQHRVQLR